ncbi:transport and Golgi organization protein 2 [Topomyia yanbarensis]|uniref:transport and Golgi organization protein 2 n=1 Tax=Topomyia yanbarensis TaxID=2498891 RepID=UPI00273CA520|nr:transport and Golgi organization protein 2 [Topomyia yanbarensis]XP_058825097.1 transport and Golgi organization protein 2 [Topomyia yanbarensis]XP_058825098.1 transport and Golgi organization protein 2 [Topomyia yanbarensis]XP_058825099.1 transport and Golgi organization protein 2 [Topomyia yanbarensis]XP_058825100.1 transport and Golgi organization protein 2 [Topomyia yanbarensis]XP_058825101.1 transport and Golgi organization protein 2 [Topomyia yanbarensis]XP_058825102.1 transport and 
MCILFIYVNNNGEPGHGEYKLILASNRDEHYIRPAKTAAPWEERPHVIGGRDMEPGREGGTWLAIGARDGVIRVGALLNVAGESKANGVTGRGPIVSDYVSGTTPNEEYSKQLLAKDTYGPFNFISVELDAAGGASVLYASNAPHKIDHCDLREPLGFGNSTLDAPLEKVKYGRKLFGNIVDKRLKIDNKDALVNELLDLLRSNEKYFPDAELSRRAPNSAEKLASINVYFPEYGYGSRTRTIILVDHENRMEFIEETMTSTNPDGEWERTHIERQF